ncbi:MAG: haloacid dehalogenase-like hydrolase [Oligoflexia bacterium]|nr:haloacid dehalogenase-like hydrolase [Oligoflexia bacterium]
MKQNLKIAVVFDFDDTLAHDSTSGFLHRWGVDVKDFWRRHRERLLQGWDTVPAYLEMIIEESRARSQKDRITARKLAAFGPKVELHHGVTSIFARLIKQAKAIHPQLCVEFYVISSGIGEILRHTQISKYFKEIWSSDFAYNKAGEIDALKTVVSFTDKTRFLFQISKGLVGAAARRDPFAVNRKVAADEIAVPFSHMIMVGDGMTDIPCFSLVQQGGGVAIGVYDRDSRERWGKALGFIEDRRVSHLVAADFRKRSGLDDALSLALDKIGNSIKLKSLSYQG